MREEWASRQREEVVLRTWEAESGVHSLTPSVCGHTTTVRGQRDFTEVVKDADLKEERLPWVIWEQCNHMDP